MQDVPKIVTDRLRTAVPLVNHPDADLLTAFSERSLPQSERDMVLEHLAGCGDCREIVALAVPAADATQTVVRPAPTRWLSWPALRWGFVAVGVFAIASLGVVQYRKHLTSSESLAKVGPSGAPVKEAKNGALPIPDTSQLANDREKAKLFLKPESAGAPAAKAQPANAPSQFDRLQTFTNLQKAENRVKKAVGGGSLGGPIPHGPSVLQFQNAQNQNAFAYQANNNSAVANNSRGAASTPSPFARQAPNSFMGADAGAAATTQTVEVQSQNQQLDGQERNTEPLQLESKTMPLEPTQGGQGHTVERAKDNIVVGMGPSKVPVSPAAAPGPFTGALSPPNASWTIAAGGLQRSVDQGKTWQNVNVNTPPAAGANYSLAVQSASLGDTRRDQDGMRKQKTLVPPVFRAVVANGPDVWAGGSSGLLYHSVDSGAHWIRVQPASGSAGLTGDVVSLDFPDAQHGKVTTSTPEVWLTADGGQTWQKQ